MSENPYQPPQVVDQSSPASTGSFQDYAEEVRRKHLGHEAQIKSIASLYQLAGVLSILGIALSLTTTSAPITAGSVSSIAVSGLLIPVQFVVAHGLTRFKTWARITALVFAFLGLIFFAFAGLAALPIGGGICVIMIVLLLVKKNKMIFSPEYQEIIKATPHIKRKGSIVYKIALVLLAVILLLTLVGFLMAYSNMTR
jgi:hypothetical protein